MGAMAEQSDRRHEYRKNRNRDRNRNQKRIFPVFFMRFWQFDTLRHGSDSPFGISLSVLLQWPSKNLERPRLCAKCLPTCAPPKETQLQTATALGIHRDRAS